MSGQNAPVLDLPPGVLRNGTPYSVGRRWWDVNQVRWVDGQLQPIGGWAKGNAFTEGVIRDAYSWRDNNKTPWYAVGTATKLKATSPTSATIRDITPASLAVTTVLLTGYGAGLYGAGYYGAAVPTPLDNVGQWSLDNFGRYLVAVHSQDGRLVSWDPTTPTVVAAPVTNAPIDNTLVVVTDERMIMVLGGKGNPRRVKWCDRENMTVWAASATNTAGSFELNSGGTIIAAVRVQGGILVLTDVDAHIIEYVGAPYYYARRRLSEEVGCVGKNALVGVTGMGFWLSKEGYWRYDGKSRTSTPNLRSTSTRSACWLTAPAGSTTSSPRRASLRSAMASRTCGSTGSGSTDRTTTHRRARATPRTTSFSSSSGRRRLHLSGLSARSRQTTRSATIALGSAPAPCRSASSRWLTPLGLWARYVSA